jgi:radical SAM-linked protein
MNDPQKYRCRITFTKTDPMRYTSHLDLHHAWERMLRRAGVPVLHTRGYNPRLRISLGLALPLGFTSECELIDVWLEEAREPNKLLQALQSSAPPGLLIQAVQSIDEDEPALQKQIQAATYEALLKEAGSISEIQARVRDVLESPELPRQRRGKAYDLRPLIESLKARPADGAGLLLVMRLSAREAATGRPEEAMLSLGLDPLAARIHRKHIHLKS